MTSRLRLIAAMTLAVSASILTTQGEEPHWGEAFGQGVKRQAPGQGTPSTPPPQAPIPAPAPHQAPASNAQAIADAESLVATFNAAHEAGATAFSTMRSTREVVAALASGVPGSGRYADTLFRVPGLDAGRQAAAERHLAIQRGRIVVRRPLPAGTPAPLPAFAPDPRTPFAGGKVLALVPRGFSATESPNGDLVLKSEGAQLTLHLEASTGGLDAWAEVRGAADRAGLAVSMSGKKVYIIEPDRRAPEQAIVGFGNTLVSIKIQPIGKDGSLNVVRLTLPSLIDSLGIAVTK